ncbi:MAG: amidase [Opitutaceae bacterium]|nr:amidase [Opitutaceae bacterium]
MTFASWRDLAPSAAARRVREAVARLSSAQQRAAIAAMPSADALAERFAAANRAAPLGAIPYFAKDLFDVAGEPTQAGSTFLAEARPLPAHDSALVARLRELGAVLAGKSHLHEFAYGLTGENPHYGDCEHPRFPGRTTGGSSSGSAALVAAGVVPFALGTDTGCSVRLPAAFCGLFGLRLTPGDRWIRDVFPLAPSFDTAGWFTATAADLLHAHGALVGWREAAREPRGAYLDWPDLDPVVADACGRAAARIAAPADRDLRRDLHEGFAAAAGAYSTIVAHEGSHGHRAWFTRYRDRYDPAVRARLEAGAALTPAQIDTANAACAAVRRRWTQVFLGHDFLVMPVAPCAALTKAECTPSNRQRILALTAPASVGGLPVLTVPVPLPDGLSAGLQIVVNHPQSPVIPWVLRTWAAPGR